MANVICRRQSLRLKGYDYSQSGAYFVTICTKNREFLFGNVINGQMQVNNYGSIVSQCWIWLSQQYPFVSLDEWVIMPNHLHGIIVISDNCRGGSRTAPTPESAFPAIKQKPLGRLIGAFKTISTKQINETRKTSGVPVWQRNYYERVVRNETELHRIRAYIANNPLNWEQDENNPVNVTTSPSHPSEELDFIRDGMAML